MDRLTIPAPISAGIILSYKCSAECKHCMYLCSPRWDADWMSAEDVTSLLSRLSGSILPGPGGEDSIGVNQGLHFSGGEPFLDFDLLLKAVEIAGQFNIPSTFVETNCSWCTSDELTRERLARLRVAGLRGILISVNPYFTEFIPFERTERCIKNSLAIFGQNVIVYQLDYYYRFKELGITGTISLEDYTRLSDDEVLSERVELFLMGRATSKLRNLYPSFPAHVFFDEPCQPPFLRSWHNHFDNYGNFIPGYCAGVTLGSWRDIDDIIRYGIDLTERPVLRFLASEDMRRLFHFAEDYGYRESPRGYLSKCDLCLDLRAFLILEQDFEELRPREFYSHIDPQSEP